VSYLALCQVSFCDREHQEVLSRPQGGGQTCRAVRADQGALRVEVQECTQTRGRLGKDRAVTEENSPACWTTSPNYTEGFGMFCIGKRQYGSEIATSGLWRRRRSVSLTAVHLSPEQFALKACAHIQQGAYSIRRQLVRTASPRLSARSLRAPPVPLRTPGKAAAESLQTASATRSKEIIRKLP